MKDDKIEMMKAAEQPTSGVPLDKIVRHWYCFTYSGKSIDDGHDCQACTYIGYDTNQVTKPMIDKNKKEAGVTASAVLIGCIYLGYMTRGEFLGA